MLNFIGNMLLNIIWSTKMVFHNAVRSYNIIISFQREETVLV